MSLSSSSASSSLGLATEMGLPSTAIVGLTNFTFFVGVLDLELELFSAAAPDPVDPLIDFFGDGLGERFPSELALDFVEIRSGSNSGAGMLEVFLPVLSTTEHMLRMNDCSVADQSK